MSRLLSFLRKFGFILMMFWIAMPDLNAQSDQFPVWLYGSVKDNDTRKKGPGYKITVFENGSQYEQFVTTSNGKYEFHLQLDKNYKVLYEKEGYVPKHLLINTSNIPPEDILQGFSIPADILLFTDIPNVDFDFVRNNPMGKWKYIPEKGDIDYDAEYTNQIKSQIEKVIKEYENQLAEQAKNENDKAQKEAELEANYQKLMKEGNDGLTQKNYQIAVNKFKEALVIKEKDKVATEKLSIAQKKLDEELAAAGEEKKYKELVDKGDNSLAAKNYQDAIDYYESALDIKPLESYPANKIQEARLSLDEINKKESDEEDYANWLSQGDQKMAKNEFEGAIRDYQSALKIKPGDKIVKDKITAAEKALINFQNEKDNAEKFDNLVAQADRDFKAEAYESAKSQYEKALKIKVDDSYVIGKIKDCDNLLSEKRLKENQVTNQAKLQADFDKFIREGDDRMAAKQYGDAIEKFIGALKIFPTNTLAKKKLSEAEKKLEEEKADLAKNDEYSQLLEKGDIHYDKKEFQAAIENYQKAYKLKLTAVVQKKLNAAQEAWEAEQAAMKDREAAERERLLREKELAGIEANFQNWVREGDQSHSTKAYEDAIHSYEEALKIKPNDREVKKKLDRVRKDWEAYKAELENNEAAKAAEAARLAELEKKRKEDEERRLREEEEAQKNAAVNAKLEAEFQAFMNQGNSSMEIESFSDAINAYTSAVALKPLDIKAQNKLNEAKSALEEQKRLAEELAKKESEEAARQAELDKQRKAEAERKRIEEAERAKKLADQRAMDAQYNAFIEMADENFLEEEYQVAKRNYEEALNIKPEESYPLSRIEKINRILAGLAEERRLAEERAERDRLKAEELERLKGSNQKIFDSDAEKLAEEIMRKKREASTKARYELSDKQKKDWKDAQDVLIVEELEAIDQNREQIENVKENIRETELKFKEDHLERVVTTDDFKGEMLEKTLGLQESQGDRIVKSKRNTEELAGKMAVLGAQEAIKTFQEKNNGANDAIRKSTVILKEEGSEKYQVKLQDWVEQKRDYENVLDEDIEASKLRNSEKQAKINSTKEAIQNFESKTAQEKLEINTAELNRIKEEMGMFYTEMNDQSFKKRERSKEDIKDIETFAIKPSPFMMDKNKLAEQYPQGVTEEQIDEEDKITIRRVVVNGNQGTEYIKVITMNGSYYFKNGISISKTLWDLESNRYIE